ncbi:MAG: mannosyltransferase family protein, partial [Armatimonadota bacterium]|nr:mannosyltransferase family protein [Armatimonadota bacterium]
MKGRLQLLRTYPEVAVALSWVVVSRATLWLIGLVSREVLQPFLPQQEPGAPFTENPFLAVWGHWDTRWYLDIARRGYSPERLPYTGEANYAFFPLYPLLMRALGPVVGDVYLAGIVVSNLSLVAAAVLLYRLARLDGDELAAERSVKYLVLLPTAFVFSAVLTEALFVALSVAAFLQARRDRWWAAGALGGL